MDLATQYLCLYLTCNTKFIQPALFFLRFLAKQETLQEFATRRNTVLRCHRACSAKSFHFVLFFLKLFATQAQRNTSETPDSQHKPTLYLLKHLEYISFGSALLPLQHAENTSLPFCATQRNTTQAPSRNTNAKVLNSLNTRRKTRKHLPRLLFLPCNTLPATQTFPSTPCNTNAASRNTSLHNIATYLASICPSVFQQHKYRLATQQYT